MVSLREGWHRWKRRGGRGRPKVFGIGLSKTGTKTLGRCMTMLGYRNCSWEEDLFAGLAKGDLAQMYRVIAAHDSFEDLPWYLFYEACAQRYPDARFVLTRRRDNDTWWASMGNHIATRHVSEERRHWLGTFLQSVVPGAPQETLHDFHLARVRAFFASAPHRLLEVCWEEDPSWDRLCAFLGEPVPAEPFPHENRGQYA